MIKHFTSTVYITAVVGGEKKVLLHKHKKLQFWLGMGGHVEENENPVETAIREVKEETGLDIEIAHTNRLGNEGSAIELHLPEMMIEAYIPRHKDTQGHLHIDCAYFAQTDKPGDVHMKEEFRWFTQADLDKTDMPNQIKIIATQALES
jgi:8-oxo-dGTP pyrophosphatase MutT (NUDIX family)